MSHQRELFPEVGVGAENNRFCRSPTEADVSFFSVHTALPWAEAAILENGVSLLDSTSKLAGLLQFFIGGLPGLVPSRGGELRGREQEKGSPCEKGTFDEIPARDSHAEGSFMLGRGS
jgi:hypothetical protein